MTELIQRLGRLQIDEGIVAEFKPEEILQSFSANFAKLDELKSVKADHEKKNFFMRWLHKGKLADAQLDSAIVQADFGKAIGQLMVVNVLQARRLSDQQRDLKTQQTALRQQADQTADHARDIGRQQRKQVEADEEFRKFVEDYFALKGLTVQGAAALIDIAQEVRSTKASMIEDVQGRLLTARHWHDEAVMRLDDELGTLHERVNALNSSVDAEDEALNQRIGRVSRSLRITRRALSDGRESILAQLADCQARLAGLESTVSASGTLLSLHGEQLKDIVDRCAGADQRLAALGRLGDARESALQYLGIRTESIEHGQRQFSDALAECRRVTDHVVAKSAAAQAAMQRRLTTIFSVSVVALLASIATLASAFWRH